ncbi:Tetraspanin-33 [Chionoecetes opilio]|uniref:Tetraspanin-33 n=1 Tax=Chionoecetes opilio TaxID=41210 RepID=A0A8J4YEA8_CHIOP|nr:Tetraspanin-33 [Chionoecetes opilio]
MSLPSGHSLAVATLVHCNIALAVATLVHCNIALAVATLVHCNIALAVATLVHCNIALAVATLVHCNIALAVATLVHHCNIALAVATLVPCNIALAVATLVHCNIALAVATLVHCNIALAVATLVHCNIALAVATLVHCNTVALAVATWFTYFWSLTIFLIAELLFAIACIIFPWKSREIIESVLSKRLIEDYRESQNTQNFVDFLQHEFECCGITTDGYHDWNVNEYFQCKKDNPSAEKCGVPASCCIQKRNMPHEVSEIINPNGCVTSVIQFLESNLYWAAGIIFGITLFQMYVTHQARSLMDQIALQRSRWY